MCLVSLSRFGQMISGSSLTSLVERFKGCCLHHQSIANKRDESHETVNTFVDNEFVVEEVTKQRLSGVSSSQSSSSVNGEEIEKEMR